MPADGSCAQCGQPRKPERSKRYGGLVATLDPFCATACARAWHGVMDTPPLPHGGGAGNGHAIKHGTRESYELCACDLCVAAVKGDGA